MRNPQTRTKTEPNFQNQNVNRLYARTVSLDWNLCMQVCRNDGPVSTTTLDGFDPTTVHTFRAQDNSTVVAVAVASGMVVLCQGSEFRSINEKRLRIANPAWFADEFADPFAIVESRLSEERRKQQYCRIHKNRINDNDISATPITNSPTGSALCYLPLHAHSTVCHNGRTDFPPKANIVQ